MANKRDDIVVNLRANATDLINNLEKVKNELEKTTNLKKTESLEKGFDSLNLQVKKFMETLKQPMDSKNLTIALKQLQKVQEQANKFSKSMSFLSKDSKATVFDVDSIRNFDEVIIRSQQDINRMSQELKTVRDEIKKTAKELNSLDRNKILDQTLNKKNIKTSDYKTAKNEARQANIVEASQRLAENESVKSQISGIEAANKKVEANIKISEKKIADWQVEIQELENKMEESNFWNKRRIIAVKFVFPSIMVTVFVKSIENYTVSSSSSDSKFQLSVKSLLCKVSTSINSLPTKPRILF